MTITSTTQLPTTVHPSHLEVIVDSSSDDDDEDEEVNTTSNDNDEIETDNNMTDQHPVVDDITFDNARQEQHQIDLNQNIFVSVVCNHHHVSNDLTNAILF